MTTHAERIAEIAAKAAAEIQAVADEAARTASPLSVGQVLISREEVEAVPVGTVITDSDEDPYVRTEDGWKYEDEDRPHAWDPAGFLPCHVKALPAAPEPYVAKVGDRVRILSARSAYGTYVAPNSVGMVRYELDGDGDVFVEVDDHDDYSLYFKPEDLALLEFPTADSEPEPLAAWERELLEGVTPTPYPDAKPKVSIGDTVRIVRVNLTRRVYEAEGTTGKVTRIWNGREQVLTSTPDTSYIVVDGGWGVKEWEVVTEEAEPEKPEGFPIGTIVRLLPGATEAVSAFYFRPYPTFVKVVGEVYGSTTHGPLQEVVPVEGQDPRQVVPVSLLQALPKVGDTVRITAPINRGFTHQVGVVGTLTKEPEVVGGDRSITGVRFSVTPYWYCGDVELADEASAANAAQEVPEEEPEAPALPSTATLEIRDRDGDNVRFSYRGYEPNAAFYLSVADRHGDARRTVYLSMDDADLIIARLQQFKAAFAAR